MAQLKSHFDSIPDPTPDPIHSLKKRFQEDPAEMKVDLTVGAYRTDEVLSFLPSIIIKDFFFSTFFFFIFFSKERLKKKRKIHLNQKRKKKKS